MRITLMVAVTALLSSAAASAAGIYAGGPDGGFKDVPPYAVIDWTGFYAGTNSGAAWSQHNGKLSVTATDNAGTASSVAAESPSGGFGGGQIGYNWQRSSLVFGLEADADWAGVYDKAAAFTQYPLTLGTAKSELDYFGTLRGRLGVTTGSFLLYGTGGFAFGGVRDEIGLSYTNGLINPVSGALRENASTTATGWAAGAGVEYAITPAMTLKAEYLHIDLGSITSSASIPAGSSGGIVAGSLTVHHDYDIVRGGLNYRLGSNEPLAVAAGIFSDFIPGGGTAGGLKDAPIFAASWGGFYGGWNSGSAWSEHEGALGVTAYNSPYSGSAGSEESPSGALGGGQIGYNWQQGHIVFGVEADADAAGVHGESAAMANAVSVVATEGTVKSDLDYFGTLRGRVGYATGSWLFYGTGGFAFGGVEDRVRASSTDGTLPSVPSYGAGSSKTAAGWAAGAGAEFALTKEWSLKTEYLHMDLGSTELTVAPFAAPLATLTVHHGYDIVRGGVNYHFSSYEPLK